MKPERPEAGEPKFIPSLGFVDRVIARATGLPVPKQCDDLSLACREGGRPDGPSRECCRRDPWPHTPSGRARVYHRRSRKLIGVMGGLTRKVPAALFILAAALAAF